MVNAGPGAGRGRGSPSRNGDGPCQAGIVTNRALVCKHEPGQSAAADKPDAPLGVPPVDLSKRGRRARPRVAGWIAGVLGTFCFLGADFSAVDQVL